MTPPKPDLTLRELGTMLAALHLWRQAHVSIRESAKQEPTDKQIKNWRDLIQIATNDNAWPMLEADEINALIDRINMQPHGTPALTAQIVNILDSGDGLIHEHMTIAEAMAAEQQLLRERDHDFPATLFQVEHDPRWWLGAIGYAFYLAPDEYVRLHQAKRADESNPD